MRPRWLRNSIAPWQLVLLALLAGCATQPSTPKVVDVPVVVPCPKVTMPPKPVFPISSMSPTAPASSQVKALVESFAMSLSDDAQLRALLAPYTKAP